MEPKPLQKLLSERPQLLRENMPTMPIIIIITKDRQIHIRTPQKYGLTVWKSAMSSEGHCSPIALSSILNSWMINVQTNGAKVKIEEHRSCSDRVRPVQTALKTYSAGIIQPNDQQNHAKKYFNAICLSSRRESVLPRRECGKSYYLSHFEIM
ncbi:unnamed protein product [Nesidiocoris tenuis]|uniref:Uncharacterized protein n=1 Tax=Nesidiocoris tenuis TaxID=355587 RepID=A0A6H5GC50_9HEMI|nr:unnamed protein product [Nesidiocoris tenuis]